MLDTSVNRTNSRDRPPRPETQFTRPATTTSTRAGRRGSGTENPDHPPRGPFATRELREHLRHVQADEHGRGDDLNELGSSTREPVAVGCTEMRSLP
jgi:hypothetical protein